MKIKIDTDELVKKEVISQQTADEIIQYYDSSKNTSTGKYALSVVAAIIFVMTGVAILIADSWDDVGTNARILFSLLPIIVGSLACYAVETKLSGKKVFTESVAILQGAAIFTTFSMLKYDVFNLELNKLVFVIFATLVCFPFVIFFKATIAATLLIVIASITLLLDCDQNVVNCGLSCLVFIMNALFFYKTYLIAKERLFLNVRLFISTFVIIAFFFHLENIFFVENSSLVYFILALIAPCYTFSFLIWNKEKQWLETDAKWLELGSFLATFITLTVGVAMHNYNKTDTIGWAIIIPFAAPLLLLWFIQKKNSIKIEFRQYFSLLAAIVVAITTPILEDHTSNIYVVLLLAFLAYHTYQWRKNYNVIFFNIAMFCWIIAICNISDVNDLGRAGVAVSIFVCGIILLALNYYLIKKKKDHELQNK
ncbi:MAG: DUF2157 domain-containing protein [Paludibacteraceae bacterium]|nr:DUF2157 domain-containing protein [Paludibacteraceae bacterium]